MRLQYYEIIVAIVFIIFLVFASCDNYSHYYSSDCLDLDFQDKCFSRKISGGVEFLYFNSSTHLNHFFLKEKGDTLLSEDNAYGIYQDNTYLRIKDFNVIQGDLIREGGGYIKSGERGNVSIAIEATKDCTKTRLVLDMESYSKEYFMYEIICPAGPGSSD